MKLVKNRKISSAISGIFAVMIFIPSILLTAKHSHTFQNWYTSNEYFDWHTMAISHFGVSNLGIPFTVIVCLISFLIIYFIVGMKKEYGNETALKRGASWVIIGFISLMLAFLSLLYEPNSTLSIAIHYFAAIIYFVCIPIGIIMIGWHFIKKGRNQLGYISLFLGIIAFISGPIICMGSSLLFGDKGVAIPEFVQIVSEDIWIIVISIDLLRVEIDK